MQRLTCIIDFADGIQMHLSESAEDMVCDDMNHSYILRFSVGFQGSMLSAERRRMLDDDQRKCRCLQLVSFKCQCISINYYPFITESNYKSYLFSLVLTY